jgi:toxin HigB-1
MTFDMCKITLYTSPRSGVPAAVIESFRHRGLKRLLEDDDRRGVNQQQVRKIRQVLALLHAAENIADLDFPTLRLHPLKADLQGFWSITVRANW